MSLQKILPSDITTNGVQSAPDKLTGSAAENKAIFDKLIANDTASVKKRFNDLIDALESTTTPTGASQIGASVSGITGSDVQTILEALKTLIATLDGCAVKTTVQSLTENEKDTARQNIGVSGSAVAVNSVNGQTGNVWLSIPNVQSVNGKTGAIVLWTDVTGTLTAGQTSITLSNAAITDESTFDYFTSIYGVNPESVTPATGSVTLTFESQLTDMEVKVRVY